MPFPLAETLPPAAFVPGGCGLPGHDTSVLQPKRDARSRGGWRNKSPQCYECRKAKGRERANARHRRRREEANRRYGPGCQCCGEPELVFLAVDHVDGGGNAHRRDIGADGNGTLYRWLETNGWPPGFRMLCHNCNAAFSVLGECPHARAETAAPRGKLGS